MFPCFHSLGRGERNRYGSRLHINSDPAYRAGPEIRVQTQAIRAELSLMGNKKKFCPFRPRNENCAIIYSPSCHSKPVWRSFLFEAQRKFWIIFLSFVCSYNEWGLELSSFKKSTKAPQKYHKGIKKVCTIWVSNTYLHTAALCWKRLKFKSLLSWVIESLRTESAWYVNESFSLDQSIQNIITTSVIKFFLRLLELNCLCYLLIVINCEILPISQWKFSTFNFVQCRKARMNVFII